MKTNILLPNRYKKLGWYLFIPGILLGILFLIYESEINLFNMNVFAIAKQDVLSKTIYFSLIRNNILNELSIILIVIGALLISFSKEKFEDEFITKIRLESLVWATYIHYGILILAILFVYEISFFWVLVFNMFTLLFVFLIRFNWALKKTKNQISDEE